MYPLGTITATAYKHSFFVIYPLNKYSDLPKNRADWIFSRINSEKNMQAGKNSEINKRAGCNKAVQVGFFQKNN